MSVCQHGSLDRKCELCERDAEIAALRAALAQAVTILETTASNIRHLHGNGTEDGVFWPYQLWLAGVDAAIAKGKSA